MPPTLPDLRRYAVGRSLFSPTTLKRAIDKLGFVQADPIRAPARAQDLTLRHRVTGYRAGDLERLYPTLDVEEDVFINYGYVTSKLHALMHPRVAAARWGKGSGRRGRGERGRSGAGGGGVGGGGRGGGGAPPRGERCGSCPPGPRPRSGGGDHRM